MGLLVDLDDSDGVGGAVGDGGGAEALEGATGELGDAGVGRAVGVGFGEDVLHGVVRGKPGVVADDVGDDGAVATVVQDDGALGLELLPEQGEALGALGLHGRLPRVDGHEEEAPARGGHRAEGGLDGGGEVLGLRVAVEDDERARVGGSVAEARERALHEGGDEAAVEAPDPGEAAAAVLIERADGRERPGAVAVLVVDRCSEPHEAENVEAHRDAPGGA
mmetsp:Transcript_8265/g.25609  ORF Transcript_8265/g.25609 Transcript_8265/m.25609 type:complete len:221 (-) Transcript_8265:236-898(-)